MRSLRFANRPRHVGRTWLFVGLVAAATLALPGTVRAETLRIVALGASNTAGYGSSSGQAWPGLLEAMLRAKGYDVSVSVQGVIGDTSAGILQRVDSVPAGTRVVVYDIGAGNDRDTGAGGRTGGNKAQIAQRIRARGAKAIFVPYAKIVGNEKTNPSAWRPNDPHHHLTTESHARVAAWLVPNVVAAVGKR
ncbi:MAG: GDSL-type esterase/lipase family protein [Croceibacterium sp.]